MGAYENPQTVIDTSGQIWANAILAVTNNAAKRAEEERKKLLEENKLFAAKLEKVANNGIDELRLIKRNAIENGVLQEQEMGEISRVMDEKTRFLKEAYNKDYILFLEHDAYNQCSKLKETEKGIRFGGALKIEDL